MFHSMPSPILHGASGSELANRSSYENDERQRFANVSSYR
jgi:hypothetical protein